MEIKSTSEALSYLYSLSLDRANFVFRGQADYAWTLQPSIYRSFNFMRYQTVEYEKTILQAKPSVPQPPLTHTTCDLEWLMLSQHYDVPTRLLDWTSDILTALFFACSSDENMNKDGALFICTQNDYPKFAAYNESAMETQELAFVSTHIINPRMRMQGGSFMIWGHAPLDNSNTESYDLWEYHEKNGKSPSLKKICIPSDAKIHILQELEKIYSITSDSLYLNNGFLEKTYIPRFKKLKEDARLATLYVTDADCLSTVEEKKARSMFKVECKNMIGNCTNLRKIG